ncbi:Cyclin-dependent kinase inhibitor 3 [Bienertia sinuspersici]
MGRYLRKCKKVVGEIAVVGVKTRARAALAMAATSQQGKKIKKVSKSSKSSSSSPYDLYQLRSRRRNLSEQENFVEKETTSSEAVDEDIANCSSSEVITTTTASSSDFPPPCCSSNNDQSSSSEVVKDRLGKRIADPEVESAETSSRDFDCNRAAPSEATKSDEQESAATKLQEPKSTVQIKMPSDSEIEEFFTSAEKDLHKRFIDKYNFDIVKDVPLEGRYEWVQLKP